MDFGSRPACSQTRTVCSVTPNKRATSERGTRRSGTALASAVAVFMGAASGNEGSRRGLALSPVRGGVEGESAAALDMEAQAQLATFQSTRSDDSGPEGLAARDSASAGAPGPATIRRS